MKIQDMVYQVASDFLAECGGFHINWVRVAVYKRWRVALSYKQARNALYRLRSMSGLFCAFCHVGRGLYVLVLARVSRVVRRVPLSRPRVIGGIYYRKLGLAS